MNITLESVVSDHEEAPSGAATPLPARKAYEAPRLTASASLEQVTLFSGNVVDGGIIFGE